MSIVDDAAFAAVRKTPNPRSAGTPPAYFSAWDLHAYYGESYIVQGVNFNIHEGEIVALLGRNGAGKTSTLRTIARLDDPALKHGEIWLDHKPVHSMKAHEASQHGIALVPEDRRIIAGLTVEENLRLAQIAPPIGWSIERIYELFPRLGERRMQEGVTLSGGEQQMLAIGRALVAEPQLIMLDEPSLGLAPMVVEEIFSIVLRINRERGAAVLLVEQNAAIALAVADYAYIMESGRVVIDGTPAQLAANQDVQEFYLGHGGEDGGGRSFRDIKHYKRRKRWLS